MTEGPPRKESAPGGSGFDLFEALVQKGVWNSEIEAQLQLLFENYEADLYMIYLNYENSGLIDTLPEHEQKMFEWLETQFK